VEQLVARWAHNPKVVSSSLAPATSSKKASHIERLSSFTPIPESVFESVQSFELQLSLKLGLVPRQNFQNITKYKKPRLVVPESQEYRWYIIYYPWHVQDNKLVRRRDYDVNDYPEEERLNFAKQRVKDIKSLLKNGYHIDLTRLSKPELISEILSVDQALTLALKVKNPEIRYRTQKSYKCTLDNFKEFLKAGRKLSLPPIAVTKRIVHSYSDYLLIEKNLSAKTRNNYFSYLRSLFTVMVDRELIEKNPFEGVEDLTVIAGNTHKPYSDEQIKFLSGRIKALDPDLWLYVQFIFYCFLRPAEIAGLRICNIEWQTEQIFIPAQISKNRKDGRVIIPKTFLNELKGLGFDKYPGNFFIFSKEQIPSPSKILDNEMTKRYRVILNELKVGYEHTLYSWKHTGNIKLYYTSKKDIILIMKQNRHHSLDMTYNYLRSLGLEVNASDLKDFQL